MENNLLLFNTIGKNITQVKKNRVLQLISISLLTLSIILAIKFIVLLLFPAISYEYYEMTIIIGSCLAVNISASLILYKYRLVLEQLEDRLELKTDNLHNVIKNLKQEREDCRRLAAGLQQRDEQYRALMNQVNEGVLLLDAEGNLLQANRKLQELLRLSEADLLSKTWAQLFPAEEGRRTAAALAQVVATGAAKLTASWIIGPDRQRIPVALACHKVNCAGKPVIQGVFTFMEPTEPRPVILAS